MKTLYINFILLLIKVLAKNNNYSHGQNYILTHGDEEFSIKNNDYNNKKIIKISLKNKINKNRQIK